MVHDDVLFCKFRYRWAMHASLMGYRPYPWQTHSAILRHVGKPVSTAQQHYLTFLQEGLARPEVIDYTGEGSFRFTVSGSRAAKDASLMTYAEGMRGSWEKLRS